MSFESSFTKFTGVAGRTGSTIRKSAVSQFFGQTWDIMGQTVSGRAFRQGLGESFGWKFEKGMNQGFLGLNKIGRNALKTSIGETIAKGGSKYTASLMHVSGGLANLAFASYQIYEGWQEGGLVGAMKGGAQAAIFQGGLNALSASVGSLPMGVLGAAAATGYGVYRFGQAAQKYGRGLRNISMGTPPVDPFGTAATMRQRSISAIQNSHISGRSVLGNEAVLFSSLMR